MISFMCWNTSWAIFQKVEGIEKALLHKVYASELDATLLYVTSLNAVFKSQDRGKTWEKIFVAKDAGLRDICVDKHMYDVIYVASSGSVYRITGNEINKVFTLPPEVESICIHKADGTIYLGTTGGLYYAQENFLKWKLVEGLPQDIPVYSIAFSSSMMYVAHETGVYLSQDKKTFERVFVVKKIDAEDEEEDEDIPLISGVLHKDIFNDDTIYLGTSRGMYASYDKGWHWQKQRIPVVENANIRSIAQVPLENNTVYLATDRGVVSVNLVQRTSQFLFEGLPTKSTYGVAFDRKGRLYVATERGLFARNHFSSASLAHHEIICVDEPTIREIQEVVLRYNEVHPEKVKRWRRSLKYRGLFPDVSLDYDKTVTYDSGLDRYEVGPYDWGVRLSWDMGDLIWNTYEDDVDTRSRLMTQLRINILDDINTIYHERLRVKKELMSNSYKDEGERFSKEVRLQELTATLDGYTGGYFSQRLKELKTQ
jgi:hypothetical protein